MIFLFEAILERLMADDLHSIRLHAAPMRRSMPDDFGWKKVNRGQLTGDQLRPGGACHRRTLVLV
jgi:hypothetical protein